MAQTCDLILEGGIVVNQDGEGVRDMAVTGGAIVEIGDLSRWSAGQRIDCRGLHVLPGVIDSQVHFREPGLTHKEDLETGRAAAVLGGVTSVFEMPNTNPLTTSAETLADKVRLGLHRMHCDFAFWVGGTHDNAKHVAELERLPGAAGIKVFMGSSTGSLLVEDDPGVAGDPRKTTRRAAFHSEDEFRLGERMHLRVAGDPASHHVWRDVTTRAADARSGWCASRARSGARIHVLHISTAEEIEFLAGHKDVRQRRGDTASPDARRRHYATLGTMLQMNPPVREAHHRDGIWRGVQQGVVDVLGSDHAPHTLEEKAKPYPRSPSGMTGVQTLVPVMLDHVNAGRLTLERFVDLTAPARAPVRHRAQGPHRGRLRRRFHHRRHEAPRDDHQRLDRARAAGWTPYRRQDEVTGLAGRHDRARAAGDVGGRDRHGLAGRAGAVHRGAAGVRPASHAPLQK